MKILLILPYDNTYRYHGFFKRSIAYAPLTLTTLAALVPDELHAEIDIIDEGIQKADYCNKTYDIVGITCVTSSAPRAYSLASYWRKQGAFVVLGGAHPSLMPEEASRFADAVIVGPGELSWPKMLSDYQKGVTQKIYCNLLSGGALKTPIPRRDLLPKNRYLSFPTIIANRGCMNHCDFCSINKLWGGEGNLRPVGQVIEEIQVLNAKAILLLDPSPMSNKNYAKEFFSALSKLKIKWAGLSTIDLTEDDELLELVVRSGCQGLLVGFESLNQLNLNENKKGFNRVERYREAIERMHFGKISVLGCFVLGFDNDTIGDLKVAADVVAELKVDLPRFSVLTPFPGMDLFAKLKNEGRILTEEWGLYDTEHVVFQPKNMTPDELQQSLYHVWTECYKIGRILKRVNHVHDRNILLRLATNLGFRYYAKHLRSQ